MTIDIDDWQTIIHLTTPLCHAYEQSIARVGVRKKQRVNSKAPSPEFWFDTFAVHNDH